jgi:hypothetical protein
MAVRTTMGLLVFALLMRNSDPARDRFSSAFEVGHRRAFVDLMHGLADKAELQHGTVARDKARIWTPPPVFNSGLRPVTFSTAADTSSVNGPGWVRNASEFEGSQITCALMRLPLALVTRSSISARSDLGVWRSL